MKATRLRCAWSLLACGYLIVGARPAASAGIGKSAEGPWRQRLRVDSNTLSSTTLDGLLGPEHAVNVPAALPDDGSDGEVVAGAQRDIRPTPPWDTPAGAHPSARTAWLLVLGLAAVLLLLFAGLCPLLWWLQRGSRVKSPGLFFQPLEPLPSHCSPALAPERVICQPLPEPNIIAAEQTTVEQAVPPSAVEHTAPMPISGRWPTCEGSTAEIVPAASSSVNCAGELASCAPVLPLCPTETASSAPATTTAAVTTAATAALWSNSLSETDSDQGLSPTRSPLRRKTRRLLERRGSNASLTLDLNKATQNGRISPTSGKDRCLDPYLRRASRRLTRTQLRACLSNAAALHSEFWDIPMNHPERAEIAGCGAKNRYRSILPNEHSRVRLLRGTEEEYINANYLRGYGGAPRAYIATQGPLAHTVADFWAMVWQERAPAIVMITNLVEDAKVKCERYLPEVRGTYGPFVVEVVRTSARDGYTMRELTLQKSGEERVRHMQHLWYTTWPDHRAPESPNQLLSLALEVERLQARSQGPVVVHCSAGIGRTGCFVASSIGIRQLREEDSVDVLAIVCALRRDRGGMVQTAEQYEFVHRTLCLFERELPPKDAR
ncbi:tyrosine-protein phosphatase non-receptor type 7-like [Amblyomma americanum]